MRRTSFITIIMVVILLCATVSIGQARGPGKGGCIGPQGEYARGSGQRGINACLADLDLSSDQIARFRKIREEHLANMDRIRQEMRTYRNQTRSLLQNGTDVDQGALEKLLDKGSSQWKEREKEHLRYRQQISALLTQEQKDRLYMCETFKQGPRWGYPQGRSVPPEE